MIDSIDNRDPLEQGRSIRAAADPDAVPTSGEDDERATAIVAQWREYLPPSCVEAMIKRGWHRDV